jgi:hypothetical protein
MDRDWSFVIRLHGEYFANGSLWKDLSQIDSREIQSFPRIERRTIGNDFNTPDLLWGFEGVAEFVFTPYNNENA